MRNSGATRTWHGAEQKLLVGLLLVSALTAGVLAALDLWRFFARGDGELQRRHLVPTDAEGERGRARDPAIAPLKAIPAGLADNDGVDALVELRDLRNRLPQVLDVFAQGRDTLRRSLLVVSVRRVWSARVRSTASPGSVPHSRRLKGLSRPRNANSW